MAGFDPEAATAAYMATLSPAAHAKATAYTQGGHWLLLWACLATLIASAIILRSGVLPRVRDRLNPDGRRPKRAVLAVAVVYILMDAAIELPWTVYAAWWRERHYQLSSQPFGDWFGEWLIQLALSAVITGLFLLALYTLIRRAPRTWWIWGSAVGVGGSVVLLILSPLLIEPLFNTYTPAPPGAVRDRVVALAEATGVPHDKIYIFNGSRQSDRYTANVSGLLGSARVAMSDTMFRQNADMAEVIGVVGHEMGHYVRLHVLWFAAFMAALVPIGLLLVRALFAPAARALGAPGIALADPAGIPVLTAVLAVLSLLATPLLLTMTRWEESDADAFSMRYAHEPDGLSKALVKTIAYRASSPSALEEFLFYDHPSVERRVHRAMLWKAAHPQGVGAPFGPLPPGK